MIYVVIIVGKHFMFMLQFFHQKFVAKDVELLVLEKNVLKFPVLNWEKFLEEIKNKKSRALFLNVKLSILNCSPDKKLE